MQEIVPNYLTQVTTKGIVDLIRFKSLQFCNSEIVIIITFDYQSFKEWTNDVECSFL